MVKGASGTLDAAFGALADPTRRAMVARLAEGECSVGELAAPFRISLPAVSRHVKVLEAAGLLERERRGRTHLCRLRGDPMRDATEWMLRFRDFWEQSFDALDTYLAESAESEEAR